MKIVRKRGGAFLLIAMLTVLVLVAMIRLRPTLTPAAIAKTVRTEDFMSSVDSSLATVTEQNAILPGNTKPSKVHRTQITKPVPNPWDMAAHVLIVEPSPENTSLSTEPRL